VTDSARLRFLDQPPRAAWSEAVELLQRLGALDQQGHVTATGKRMRELPLPPRFAHMVVESGGYGQALDAAMLAVLLSERSLGGNAVDLSHRLDRFRTEPGERALAARRLARSIAHDLDRGVAGGLSAGALLSLAWPDRIARSRGANGGFRLANGRGAVIDETEALSRAEFLVVAELQGAAAAQRVLSAAALSLEEIEILHGKTITSSRELSLDAASGRIRARQTRRLGAILLSATPVEVVAGDGPEGLLFRHLRESGLDILDWGKAAARLRARLAFLHGHDPRWPDVSDASLLAGLEDWLLPYLPAARAISDIDPGCLHEGLCGLLALSGQSRAEAERLAPESFTTPAGSHIPIRYADGNAFLAVRVQELFGLARHPCVLGGAVPLTLELLSPAHRPIQVTADLPGFWSGSWREVRTEMRGRYPRHPWPEDPANATPTTRAKPRGQ
jgi:ATP-dependent helicase HrpB